MFNLDGYTFVFVILNLIVLMLILRKLLFKRVGDFLRSRKEGIVRALADAEEARKAVAQAKAELDALGREAKALRDSMKQKAEEEAKEAAAIMLGEAKAESDATRAAARAEAGRMRAEAYAGLREEAIGLAFAVAGAFIKQKLGDQADLDFVRRQIAAMGERP